MTTENDVEETDTSHTTDWLGQIQIATPANKNLVNVNTMSDWNPEVKQKWQYSPIVRLHQYNISQLCTGVKKAKPWGLHKRITYIHLVSTF